MRSRRCQTTASRSRFRSRRACAHAATPWHIGDDGAQSAPVGVTKTPQTIELVLVFGFKQTRGCPSCRISALSGSGMIDATECRELAAECRQMADRAQTIRVRSILIDIANVGQISARNRAQRARMRPKQVLRQPPARRS
jgi:hypothetical protein